MRREVIFRPEAERDVHAISDYTIAQWGKRQAHAYVTDLRHVIEKLAANGLRHPLADQAYPGLRRARSGHHLVFYLIDERTVDIVRILHERMDLSTGLT